MIEEEFPAPPVVTAEFTPLVIFCLVFDVFAVHRRFDERNMWNPRSLSLCNYVLHVESMVAYAESKF